MHYYDLAIQLLRTIDLFITTTTTTMTIMIMMMMMMMIGLTGLFPHGTPITSHTKNDFIIFVK